MNGNELLPSWSQGAAKSAVLEFVESVSRPGASHVPPAERIATFDNDGTLWCEKPQYAQADFVFRRWKQMVEADPAKAREQPYKALVENDQAWLKNLLDHVPDLVKGVTEAYEGITVEAFEQAVREFFATATHPTLGLPYTKVGYQPMRGAARPAPRARLRSSSHDSTPMPGRHWRETACWRRSGRTTSTTVCRLLSRRATGRRSSRTSRRSKRNKRTKGPEGDRVMDPRGRLLEEDACSSLSLPSP